MEWPYDRFTDRFNRVDNQWLTENYCAAIHTVVKLITAYFGVGCINLLYYAETREFDGLTRRLRDSPVI